MFGISLHPTSTTDWSNDMFEGFPKTAGRFAVAAAASIFVGGFAFTPAHAADLGGDCCADLEERVAELEATTVRKGNTKVSLTLRGQITKTLLYWDDGVDDDIYVGDHDSSGSRFMLLGSAKVNSNFEVGFYVEYDIQTNPLNDLDQVTANTTGSDIIDASDVYLFFSGPWGRLAIGRNDEATQGITEIDLGGTYVAEDPANFALRSFFVVGGAGAGDTWGGIVRFDAADGTESEIVKYDSPTIAGFTVTATWGAGSDAAGEDEQWDVALKYAQEFGAIRVAAGIGARQETTGTDAWGGSVAAIHVPTGLNVSFHYGDEDDAPGGTSDFDDEMWYVKVGVLGAWSSLGKTAIYGAYGQYDRTDFIDVRTNEVDAWTVGFLQNIDAAATELYLTYKHFDVNSTDPVIDGEELDVVFAGARIKF